MMRLLVLLSVVGAAIYALLVVTDMPVEPDGKDEGIVVRPTRLSAWGPYLPDRRGSQKSATPQRPGPFEKTTSYGAERQLSGAYQASGVQSITVRSTPIIPGDAPSVKSLDEQIGSGSGEAIWFVVSRAARLHAGPSVSSPTVHFYPVGTELKLIGHEQGWFRVLDPTTSRTGWIYERYYLHAIPGPGQTRLVVQDSPPTRVAFVASEPKAVNRIKQPRPAKNVTKPRQRIRMASARADESVASIMERAFRRN
jgi:hypothetical protein